MIIIVESNKPKRLALRWERNAPKTLRSIVLFNKFNSVGMNPTYCAHLGNDPRSYLGATFVLDNNSRAKPQFTIQLDGRSVLVQVRGLCRHRKGAFRPVLT